MYHYKDPFNKKERNKRGENFEVWSLRGRHRQHRPGLQGFKTRSEGWNTSDGKQSALEMPNRNEQYERNNWIRYGKFTYISPKFMVNGSYGKETPDCFDIGNTDYTTQLCGHYTTNIIRIPQKTASISWKVRPMFFFSWLEKVEEIPSTF